MSKEVGGIEDILKCYICYNVMVKPLMCPQCSKMCCGFCFEKWMEQKQQCPHCLTNLAIEQLVNCRFFDDFNQEVQRIKTTSDHVKEELCKEHGVPLLYYCHTCNIPFCSDCVVFHQKHRDHQFERIGDVYVSKVNLIHQELGEIHTRLDNLQLLESHIDENINHITSTKDEIEREMKTAYDEMNSRLSNDLKSKMVTLFSQKNDVLREANLLESLLHELSCQLDVKLCAKSQLITKAPDLMKMLKEIHAKPISQLFREPLSAEFTNEIVPSFACGTLLIPNFPDIRNKKEIIYSEPLLCYGQKFRLKVYPNGNGSTRGQFMSVFLELTDGFDGSGLYEYRVDLYRHVTDTLVSRSFTSAFERGECWGYNKFFHVDLLEERGYLGDNNTLRLDFYIRSPNYYHLHLDHQRHIKHLQSQIETQKPINLPPPPPPPLEEPPPPQQEEELNINI